ncbi:hypothetical protein [Actinopolyspora alba]|uniref:hypothetical protein n=1 Tax=Actinopolyspora alba TaxID=673379 RepID=UPI0015874A52|nr:hypothetical protein [Actinopolyspora alba]
MPTRESRLRRTAAHPGIGGRVPDSYRNPDERGHPDGSRGHRGTVAPARRETTYGREDE